MQHWESGGHDTLCKPIKKAGGAEQYNANNKYSEAVAVAAEACAEDTKGQTCYICTQALHWKTKEGLVRGCSCRGTAGFAHVSCLAEQAKILLAEALENNLDAKVKNQRFNRWHTCSLCEQRYHGVVYCALGWACWKTYLGRPERDETRSMAMSLLGSGLTTVKHHEDAFCVQTAELALMQRHGAWETSILTAQSNLAYTCGALGRYEDALSLHRDVYFGFLKIYGEENEQTLGVANNYASDLNDLERFGEAKSLLRKTVPVARRVLGESHDYTLKMRKVYAITIYEDSAATLDDLRECVATLEDLGPTSRRVLGDRHPTTAGIECSLQNARAVLAAREGDVESIREAVEAMAPGDA